MKKVFTIILIIFFFSGCTLGPSSNQDQSQDSGNPSSSPNRSSFVIKALAVETFLMDITQNISGELVQVDSLMPIGLDPHAFEPTPQDIIRINSCDVLIINGAGLETWLEPILKNAGGHSELVDASSGLIPRTTREDLKASSHNGSEDTSQEGHSHEVDPHFWLDPILVIHYVENIRDGLEKVDPSHNDTYRENAKNYIQKLNELDGWIRSNFDQIPANQRLLVTNHESFNYFADRYGFKVVGTVIPSFSSNSSPSAQQMAKLINEIRSTGAKAVFLETGSNPQLAEQIAQETGLKVVTDLYSHSITPQDGKAPTYLDMMRQNAITIKTALATP